MGNDWCPMTTDWSMGLSRLSDQGRMVAMSGGSRPNHFLQMCHCRPTYYILYIVMCDINMTTTFDNAGVNTAWLEESRILRGIITPMEWPDKPLDWPEWPMIFCVNFSASGGATAWHQLSIYNECKSNQKHKQQSSLRRPLSRRRSPNLSAEKSAEPQKKFRRTELTAEFC